MRKLTTKALKSAKKLSDIKVDGRNISIKGQHYDIAILNKNDIQELFDHFAQLAHKFSVEIDMSELVINQLYAINPICKTVMRPDNPILKSRQK